MGMKERVGLTSEKESRSLRILIVEDNIDISENIGDYFEGKGHILDFAMEGIGGLHLALTQDYDIIVLDIMMPGMDGLTFCRKLRTEAGKPIPVLMLTARDTLEDKLEGFNAGADDYLVKPFAMEELNARIEALARRTDHIHTIHLQVADLELDIGVMKVSRAGRPIMLNRVCLKILTLLMRAYPNVVARKELEHALWGDMLPGSDALRSHIYTLRQAIDKPFKKPLLETVHGIGYRLVGHDDISL
jgi:DNA-binding response OmpR family regulator